MKFEFKFSDIQMDPLFSVSVNGDIIANGLVCPSITSHIDIQSDKIKIEITHYGKTNRDTITDDQNNIIMDKCFTLDKIIIDGYDLEELIWESYFEAVDGQRYDSCLFFGPNGTFHIEIDNPIIYWILKTRGERDSDDSWKEDYDYYQKARKILNV